MQHRNIPTKSQSLDPADGYVPLRFTVTRHWMLNETLPRMLLTAALRHSEPTQAIPLFVADASDDMNLELMVDRLGMRAIAKPSTASARTKMQAQLLVTLITGAYKVTLDRENQ